MDTAAELQKEQAKLKFQIDQLDCKINRHGKVYTQTEVDLLVSELSFFIVDKYTRENFMRYYDRLKNKK